MDFAKALKNESAKTYTENGAQALNTTGNAVLDLFGTIGALRNAEENRITTKFAEAYNQSPLLATKCLFYARDVRGGLGERHVFRTILKFAANHFQESLRKNLFLIPEYGRWDDMYALIGTPLEEDMWKVVKTQLNADIINMAAKLPVSLMAKWLKTPDASSKETRKLGRITARALNMETKAYKNRLRTLRKYLKITEVSMSANKWTEIDYPSVPSRASMIYRNAFKRHDEDRYNGFLEKVTKGEAKINAATLYPYDIIESYLKQQRYGYSYSFSNMEENATLEAQWNALPNYVEEGTNAIVIADTSGSMVGRPMNSAVGLAIYFAERNTGAYHNLWMSFSEDSKVQKLRGKTLAQKLGSIDTFNWGCNTDLAKAFRHILKIAIDNNVKPEEMVKSIIVISDMEIDSCAGRSWTFYDKMMDEYAEHGYTIPNVIFWNVDSRHDVFHADAKRKGVQLCSGQSTSTFKALMGCIGSTPVEMMLKVLNSERYAPVTIA